MAEVRSAMAEEMEEVIDSTARMFDWRQYVRRYPWACAAAAAAVGYWIVPRASPAIEGDSAAPQELAQRHSPAVRQSFAQRADHGWLGLVLGVLANAAARGVSVYFSQQFHKSLGAGGGRQTDGQRGMDP